MTKPANCPGRIHRAFIAIVITVLVGGCSGSSTTTPTAALVPYETATGCCGWDTQASGGTPAKLTAAVQGFQFAFPVGPNSIHYLAAPQAGLALKSSMTATFNISGTAPVFIETNPCTPTPGPGLMRLYFQETGDTWSGAGAFAYYRWWSVATYTLKLAQASLAVNLQPSLWSSVMGENGGNSAAATAGFHQAMNSVQAFGVTFGGCFAGHGAQLSSGNATFNMMNFTAQ